MNDLLNYLQNELIVLVLLAAAAVTIASFIVLPALFRPTQAIKPKKEGQGKGPKKEGVNSKYDFLPTKRATIQVSLAILIGLAMVGASYLAYDFFFQPVRIVRAAQFKFEKGKDIKELQQRKLGSTQKSEVALVDIRSRSEYAIEHLKGSASLPAELVVKRNLKVNLDIAVYSSADEFEEARRVAEAIRKNAESTQNKYKEKIGKIYVISDGYEGLKNAGLITESGAWD